MDKAALRLKERQQTLLKYSSELSSSFVNVKKHEFLVKRLKKKLGDAVYFLERKEDGNLLGVLRVVIEEEVGY